MNITNLSILLSQLSKKQLTVYYGLDGYGALSFILISRSPIQAELLSGISFTKSRQLYRFPSLFAGVTYVPDEFGIREYQNHQLKPNFG